MNHLITLTMAIYLGGAFLIALLWRENETVAGAAAISFVALSAITSVLLGIEVFTNGSILYFAGGWERPLGIALMLDPLSALFLIMTNVIALLVTIYSAVYMKKYTWTPYFYVLFLIMLAGMNGILISMDIFNIYVFLEVASVASFMLVAFGLRAEELEAAIKYTVMSFIATTMILFAIALIYGFTGTLNIARFMDASAGLTPVHLWFLAGLLLAGFALKAALVPFHSWLPDAHSMAPAPVSAVLSGMFVKVAGLYVIIRVTANIFTNLPQIRILLLLFGALSMVFGGLMAYGQKNIKRLYAYSTISQIGYCAVGLGIGGYLGSLGVLMHFVAHAFSKALLFLNIGAVEYVRGTVESDDLKGLNDTMPVTTLFGSTGMLGIAGVPPMGNFWSKLIIIIAAVKAGYTGIAILCIVVAVITLGYFLKLQRTVYCNLTESPVKKEAPKTLLVPMGILAFMVFVSGVLLVPGIREHTLDKAVAVMENFSYVDITIGDNR